MAYDSNAPRKPFIARGSRINRCLSCLLPKKRCICCEKPLVESKAVFWLLTHHDELYKPTNTGRLIVDAIKGSRVFEWSRTEPEQCFIDALQNPDYYPCIVFPSGEGYENRMISANTITAQNKTPAFIILDGTWRQARRMFRLSRYLDHLPVIQAESAFKSGYHLRQAAEEHHLCTAEVGVSMLQDINDTLGAEALGAYFQLFNAEYLQARRSVDTSDESLLARERLAAFKPSKLISDILA